MAKESFGNWFREACKAAGVPGSAHGLRKAGATLAAENGATTTELKSMFGWTDDSMPAHYTRTADRARSAAVGMSKLERKEHALSPHLPPHLVSAPTKSKG
jgi:integrase